jgi:hypothetical protein
VGFCGALRATRAFGGSLGIKGTDLDLQGFNLMCSVLSKGH